MDLVVFVALVALVALDAFLAILNDSLACLRFSCVIACLFDYLLAYCSECVRVCLNFDLDMVCGGPQHRVRSTAYASVPHIRSRAPHGQRIYRALGFKGIPTYWDLRQMPCFVRQAVWAYVCMFETNIDAYNQKMSNV